MGKLKYSNFEIIALGLLAIGITLSSLLFISFITKGYIHNYAIAQLGATGDFFNGIVSPFISIVSALLIYIAFKQQIDANTEQEKRFTTEILINKADKDFDRYMKLIDEVEKYEERIQIVVSNAVSGLTTPNNGKDAITVYANYLKLELKFRRFQTIENRVEFEKSTYTYFVYLNFILSNVNNLKKDYFSYYIFLTTKLFMNIPHIMSIINELVNHENVITNDNKNKEGMVLWIEIMKAKSHIDFITYK